MRYTGLARAHVMRRIRLQGVDGADGADGAWVPEAGKRESVVDVASISCSPIGPTAARGRFVEC